MKLSTERRELAVIVQQKAITTMPPRKGEKHQPKRRKERRVEKARERERERERETNCRNRTSPV